MTNRYRNLLEETKLKIKESNHSIKDIDFINLPDVLVAKSDGVDEQDLEWGKPQYWFAGKWKHFKEYSKNYTSYDSGFGGREVNTIEIIFKDKTWLNRGEYDGSEWWNFNKTPTKKLSKEINERN